MSTETSANRVPNIILGITGSVASIKLEELIDDFKLRFDSNICIIPTDNALKFIDNFDQKFNRDLSSLKEKLDFIKNTIHPKTIEQGTQVNELKQTKIIELKFLF
jgi:phosphopantothenoylcysteine synthetase/decarboxylase